ncbi:helix-turn-helix transcriptional regulator [Marinomonas sp. A79]|uniref:Helix-turn-helix transcriptional regulator n=1 Tax=Marinomonas vulgaris TaxID=2823372 RepID=A0ABS5HE20_9GAMM|nr:AraC family transcriptional regulator [Marinomonas vulgaris]MBR7889757.1 helix-turn-helix transcriptional regulator [Marinomonas vulgaris]
MDRLSSVLNAFRPKTSSVDCLCLDDLSSGLFLSAEFSYWVYIVSGDVTLCSKENGDIRLYKGDGVWLATGQKLDVLITPDHQQQVSLLLCEYDFGTKALNPLLDLEWQWVLVSHDDVIAQQLAPLNTLLLGESLQPRCGSQAVVERLAEAYLVQLLRLFLQTQKIQLGLMAGLSDIRLAKAIVAIHEQPQQAWQVASLAEKAGMSRSVFSGAFKATMGMTPMAYLTSWRMRLAAQRIKNGDKNIAMLSDQLGYQSEAAFRRTFKKVIGVAPGGMNE